MQKTIEYEEQHCVALWIRDSRTIETARKKGSKRKMKSELVYSYLTISCYHGGRKFQTCSKGIRPNQKYNIEFFCCLEC